MLTKIHIYSTHMDLTHTFKVNGVAPTSCFISGLTRDQLVSLYDRAHSLDR